MSTVYDEEEDSKKAEKLAEALNEADFRGARYYFGGEEIPRLSITIGAYEVKRQPVGWMAEHR